MRRASRRRSSEYADQNVEEQPKSKRVCHGSLPASTQKFRTEPSHNATSSSRGDVRTPESFIAHSSTSSDTEGNMETKGKTSPAVYASPEGKEGAFKPCTKEEAATGDLGRPVRVYADGIYDLFHAGHARQLMQCKNLFPEVHLIVGCCSDELTHRLKGRTVNNEWERYENLSHCRYVDEIIKDAPWELDHEFLNKHHIDFVAHDEAPYTIGGGASNDIYKWIKDDGRFCATQRTEGVSTSDLITRIIKNYDMYIRRQLSRGVEAKDLNINVFKEAELKAKMAVQKVEDKFDQTVDKVKDKTSELLREWREKSRDFFLTFLNHYGMRRMEAIDFSNDDESHSSRPSSPRPWSPLSFLRTKSNEELDQVEASTDTGIESHEKTDTSCE